MNAIDEYILDEIKTLEEIKKDFPSEKKACEKLIGQWKALLNIEEEFENDMGEKN